MDWATIGKIIGPLAPTIGGLIGGFLPIPLGSSLGAEAGQLIADALGVKNDPNAIGAALNTDPNAASKIQAAESEAAAKWPAMAQMASAKFASNATESSEINATMKAELAAGQSWWTWRNLYGYSVGFECTVTSWIIFYALLFDPRIFQEVSQSFTFFLSWYGLRMGLLGYIHNGSSNEKIAAVTGEVPSTLAKVVKAIKGK